MKKAITLAVMMLIVCAPLSFASMDAVCNWVASDAYTKQAAGKLLRGAANAGLGWMELFRQPMNNSDKLQGLGQGVTHAIGRTVVGVMEAVTFPFPSLKLPEQNPACPLDMLGGGKKA